MFSDFVENMRSDTFVLDFPCDIMARYLTAGEEVKRLVVYGFCSPEARKHGYRLLAYGVRRHWALDDLPEICREERGKPFFLQTENRFFNISHSGDRVVCALDDEPVGIDIQKVRPFRKGLRQRVCSREELEWLDGRGGRDEEFALLWAMKESKCKHSGQGLRLPVSEIDVPLPRADERELEREGLRFYLSQGTNWRLCLCGTGTWDGTIRWIDETDILEIGENAI